MQIGKWSQNYCFSKDYLSGNSVDTISHLLLFYGIYSGHIHRSLLQLRNRDQIEHRCIQLLHTNNYI